jgi:hypothetical protein
MQSTWSFAELAMEAMFQIGQQGALKQGIVLTREEFWRTPGVLIMTAQGYMELMRAGVVSMAFQQHYSMPQKRPGIDFARRN